MTEHGNATRFTEVAPDVYVLRYPVLDVNVTLVPGDGAALLVDTLATGAQARALAEAARQHTDAPLTVVNTHHHFDHCFGNATVTGSAGGTRAGVPVYAHEETAARLAARADTLPQEVSAAWAATDPALATEVATVHVRPPTHEVRGSATLTVGGRTVVLHHPGRGHTAGDLVVEIPDADVLVTGDLVEEGAPPSFEDAYPLAWPEALATLLPRTGGGTTVVPGHGAIVDREFVHAQHAVLTDLAWLIRDGHAVDAPVADVAARAPYPAETAHTAVTRGYTELAGVD